MRKALTIASFFIFFLFLSFSSMAANFYEGFLAGQQQEEYIEQRHSKKEKAANEYANGGNLQWGLKMLKDVSGMIGAAEACNNTLLKNDAIRAHQAILKALVKNGIIKEGEAPHIITMGAETALRVKKDFLIDSPVSCTELPEVWQTIKTDIGL